MKNTKKIIIVTALLFTILFIYLFYEISIIKKAVYCRDIAIESTIRALYNDPMIDSGIDSRSFQDTYYYSLENCSKNYIHSDWRRNTL
jgi:uncharacterized membrane protein (DUF106 family)